MVYIGETGHLFSLSTGYGPITPQPQTVNTCFLLLNFSVMSFPKFVNMAKNTPHPPNFARFCTPKLCTRVHCLVLKNNPNYANFFTRMISNFKYKWPPGLRLQGDRPVASTSGKKIALFPLTM